MGVRIFAVSLDPPWVSARIREKLRAEFTFLSDPKGELLDRLGLRHRLGYRKRDIAFPAAILVDKQGIVRWVYEAELGHMRMTPADLFNAMERLELEDQNRELLRGRAVSKVVRQVFLMKRPEDLAFAIEAMRDELRNLGVQFVVCGVAIVDREGEKLRIISAAPPEGDSTGERLLSFELPLSDCPETEEIASAFRDRQVSLLRLESESCSGSFRDVALRHSAENELDRNLEFLLNVPFSHGTVFIGGAKAQEPGPDQLSALTEFAEAISVAYQRFVDFQSLENRTRELQETQLQLIQSEKMAALGQLVAGVAHELNTPMGAIYSNTQSESKALERLFALLGTEDGEGLLVPEVIASVTRLREMNVVNEAACRRIIDIVSNLRRFARLDESEWKLADLREGLEQTLALVEHQTRGRIEIVRSYDDVPLVGCYPSQLNQVFMNLIVNAIQAIDGRGRIEIVCRLDGEAISVVVRDNGHGIAEDAIPRIFDPGYTTKGVGVGTGLGLSIAYRIVSNHGGSLSVRSDVGRGTEFTVSIPLDLPPPRLVTAQSAYTSALRS